ncbi:hypothetical protein [Methylobacter sp.]|uniref:hypothetical protein n=1 Tax=Methylobacter sp. TaxID=2051955 RepID=UPI003DA57A26
MKVTPAYNQSSIVVMTKGQNMKLNYISKVIRNHYAHITRADYNDIRPLLGSENVTFPKVKSLQARALCRLLKGEILSHRDFDFATHSYRLGGYIGFLRDKGWTIVNHDEVTLTRDIVPRKAEFTRYELFAEFTPELQERIQSFCEAVDELELRAMEAAKGEVL